ncbi:hypothetical protein BaRGS_00024433, partial [Batillaria attramentaria]
MDRQIKTYSRLYVGNWNHGGLTPGGVQTAVPPSARAGLFSPHRGNIHPRRSLRSERCSSSLEVILDERMFYQESDQAPPSCRGPMLDDPQPSRSRL